MARCPSCKRGIVERDAQHTTRDIVAYRCLACDWRASYKFDGKEHRWVEVKEKAPVASLAATTGATVKANTKTTASVAEKEPEMNITEVRITVKFSGKCEDGTWRGVDVGATAALNGEDAEFAQRQLYETVKAELARVWTDTTSEQLNTEHNNHDNNHNGNGHNGNGNGNGNNAGFCKVHGVEMKRWEKDGRTWYSHMVDGKWCAGK